MMMLLPVHFRPFNDEMPLSWMQRMALANGFDDLREMMHIIGIISKPYDYPSSDHWKDVAKMFYDQEWIKSYQDEVKKASLLIDNMITKKIYICPQCLILPLFRSKVCIQHHVPFLFLLPIYRRLSW